MTIFLQEVEKRIGFLQRIIAEKEHEVAIAPEGTLNICDFKGRTQYYVHRDGKRKYIKECERQLVKGLCQKDYDQKVLRTAQKELKQLENLRAYYRDQAQETICENVYENMFDKRRQFVIPIKLSDEEFIKQWDAVEYERKSFREDAPEYYTEKGERVRSKTELLIANMLSKYRIPYRYEYPLLLKEYGLIHPDFLVLNVRTRKEIYFEHLGMMDDEGYREEALKRISAYEKNGIFPGDGLVLTHETSKNPVNSRILEEIICHYFM